MGVGNEVANELKKYTVGKKNTDKVEISVLALNRLIFALEEQEPIFDKIKEEIKDNTYFINETTEKEGIDYETVEKIIDKYRTESEE